jgi:hypothetical protein
VYACSESALRNPRWCGWLAVALKIGRQSV